MHYRCKDCGASEWRGFFPQQTFHPRYTIFHGIALGLAAVTAKEYVKRAGDAPEGWAGGLMSLAVAAVVLLVIYGLAIAIEVFIIAFLQCTACGSHGCDCVRKSLRQPLPRRKLPAIFIYRHRRRGGHVITVGQAVDRDLDDVVD